MVASAWRPSFRSVCENFGVDVVSWIVCVYRFLTVAALVGDVVIWCCERPLLYSRGSVGGGEVGSGGV
jgi:hypothetical protein